MTQQQARLLFIASYSVCLIQNSSFPLLSPSLVSTSLVVVGDWGVMGVCWGEGGCSGQKSGDLQAGHKKKKKTYLIFTYNNRFLECPSPQAGHTRCFTTTLTTSTHTHMWTRTHTHICALMHTHTRMHTHTQT